MNRDNWVCQPQASQQRAIDALTQEFKDLGLGLNHVEYRNGHGWWVEVRRGRELVGRMQLTMRMLMPKVAKGYDEYLTALLALLQDVAKGAPVQQLPIFTSP